MKILILMICRVPSVIDDHLQVWMKTTPKIFEFLDKRSVYASIFLFTFNPYPTQLHMRMQG